MSRNKHKLIRFGIKFILVIVALFIVLILWLASIFVYDEVIVKKRTWSTYNSISIPNAFKLEGKEWKNRLNNPSQEPSHWVFKYTTQRSALDALTEIDDSIRRAGFDTNKDISGCCSIGLTLDAVSNIKGSKIDVLVYDNADFYRPEPTQTYIQMVVE